MPSQDESHKAVIFAAIVFVLFGTYVSYAMFLSGQPERFPSVKQVAAESGEGSENDQSEDSNSEDEDDSKSEEDDSKSEEDDESEDKADKEAEKKKREAAREAAKKQQEALKRAAKQSGNTESSDAVVNGVKLRGDGTVDDTQELSETSEMNETDGVEDSESSGQDESEAMYKDQTKTKERLMKKLAQAEEKIMKKQAEGVDVTAALAALALAKERANDVDGLFTTNQLDKVKALVKEVERLAHAARGKVLHASEKVAKDVAKIDKRITQTKRKIAELEAAGGNAGDFKNRLTALEGELADLKTKMSSTSDEKLTVLASLEGLERRVKSLKSAVESALLALGVSDDDEFETEYVAEVGSVSDDISDLAEIAGDEDGEENKGLMRLADSHRESATRAAALVKKYENRSVGMRELFGDDRKSLTELQSMVAENEARIAAMERAVDSVSDPDVKNFLTEKVTELKGENNALQTFVNTRPVERGLFGWLFNWF